MNNKQHLITELEKVQWQTNVAFFCNHSTAPDSIATNTYRIAIWAKQLEAIESKNPAICFVREMQVATQLVAANIALAIYKSAAAAMRTATEAALYFTYFRHHPQELATLSRMPDWHIKKEEIIDYHKRHTPEFAKIQEKLGFHSKYNVWYSKISAIIHGQIPGIWHDQASISEIKPNEATLKLATFKYAECVEIIELLFFCTVGRELWPYFTASGKDALLYGMSGDKKKLLQLDAA